MRGMFQISSHTWQHVHNPYALLAQEVANLYQLAAILDVHIDGKVGVHKPHFVLEARLYALDQVLHTTVATTLAHSIYALMLANGQKLSPEVGIQQPHLVLKACLGALNQLLQSTEVKQTLTM